MFAPEVMGIPGLRTENFLLFNQDEMDAIVAEAKTSRAPVAAHAGSPEAVTIAARAGVTTVEHGFEPMKGSKAIETMAEMGTIFVPTLAVLEISLPDIQYALDQVREAHEASVMLATGGDTGAFAHGDNARELELMLKAGIPLADVLVAATVNGWRACGGDWCGRRFGWFEEGCAADIIGLDSDVRQDVGALRQVGFVMKDAKVWKKDGQAVGMV